MKRRRDKKRAARSPGRPFPKETPNRRLHAGGVASPGGGVGRGVGGGGVGRGGGRRVQVRSGAEAVAVGGGGVERVDGRHVIAAHQGVVLIVQRRVVGSRVLATAASRDEQGRTGNHRTGHHFRKKVTHLETP